MGPWPVDDVERALRLVQGFDPTGVAARDLQECLLLQLRHLGLEGTPTEKIVTEHLRLLQNHQVPEIARKLGLTIDDLKEHIEIIRHLDPKPGSRYNPTQSQYVIPDVYVIKVEDQYVAVLNEDGLPQMRISPVYRRLLDKGAAENNDETRAYVKDKFRSALWLIKSVEQRQKTIHKVANSIINFQRDFLDHGIEHLRPLVLRDVANDIGMHESTVSRVVTNKYMHTPQGVFEMKYFFHSGISSSYGESVSSVTIKQRIRKIIENEDPRKPLSDSKIVSILQREGLMLARRTIAKYREELKIPTSNQRKVCTESATSASDPSAWRDRSRAARAAARRRSACRSSCWPARGLDRLITSPHVQKTGLALAGFHEYLQARARPDLRRERNPLSSKASIRRRGAAALRLALTLDFPCVLITGGFAPPPELVVEAERANVPLLRTPVPTPTAIAKLTSILEDRLAERDDHARACCIDVLGLGVLIVGESGIGKSECALDSIVRGHRLVADDTVEIRRRSETILIGTCPELTRHHMELRGLGVINVKDLFGIASTRSSKRVELVVQLERWDPAREYERLGLDDEFYEMLGLARAADPHAGGAGRNIAILVEVAARNQLLRVARPPRGARAGRPARADAAPAGARARRPAKTRTTKTRRSPSEADGQARG